MGQPAFSTADLATAHNDRCDALHGAVRMQAHLRDRGKTRFEVEMVDLSIAGCRAETTFTLWPGTTVWLTVPGLAGLETVVAWRDRYRYGCVFVRPLSVAVFEHIVALSRA